MDELRQRKQLRLKTWDYNTDGAYFVTVCAAQKEPLFGSVVGVGARHDSPVVQLSPMGKIVDDTIQSLPEHVPGVFVDKYVIMPNHVHLILRIHWKESVNKGRDGFGEGGRGDSGGVGRASHASPLRNQSVYAKAVGYLKATASKEIHRQIMKDADVWQRGSYDHIIRNEPDYRRIWHYIDTNPQDWQDDCYYRG